jgi:hypothetical protein
VFNLLIKAVAYAKAPKTTFALLHPRKAVKFGLAFLVGRSILRGRNILMGRTTPHPR